MAKIHVANAAAQGGRHRDPDQRRARLLQGHAAGMDLPLRPAGAAGGRRRRGAQDGARPLPCRGGRRLLALGRGARGMTRDAAGTAGFDAARAARLSSTGRFGAAGRFALERISGGQSNPTCFVTHGGAPHGAAQEAGRPDPAGRARHRPRVPRAERAASGRRPGAAPDPAPRGRGAARHALLPDGAGRGAGVPRLRPARPAPARAARRSTCGMAEALAAMHAVRPGRGRARRLRPARQLLRAPDRPLDPAVAGLAGRDDPGARPARRLAAGEPAAGRRRGRDRARRFPARQPAVPPDRAARRRHPRLGAVDARPSAGRPRLLLHALAHRARTSTAASSASTSPRSASRARRDFVARYLARRPAPRRSCRSTSPSRSSASR